MRAAGLERDARLRLTPNSRKTKSKRRTAIMRKPKRDKRLPPLAPNNCAIREHTADGVPVGRCWHFVRDGQCPRHGDVTAVQRHYAETGKLTDDRAR